MVGLQWKVNEKVNDCLLSGWVVGEDDVILRKLPNVPRSSYNIIQKKKFSKKKKF